MISREYSHGQKKLEFHNFFLLLVLINVVKMWTMKQSKPGLEHLFAGQIGMPCKNTDESSNEEVLII